MTVIEQTNTETITLTQSAADAVRDLLAKKDLTGYALRVFISGGGCSGFQYGMALDNNIRPEDTLAETNGIQVVVDEISFQYLTGATIDYVDTMMGSGFKIINPNAASTCGCGQSFRTSGEATSNGSCNGCG